MTEIARRAARLLKPELSIKERFEEVSDLRERTEMFHHPREYPNILDALLPTIEKLLNDIVPVALRSDDLNHKTRVKLMEILHRLPVNEAVQKHASRFFNLCLNVVKRDNEENAIIAIKILFELVRTLTQDLKNECQIFMDFVMATFNNLDSITAAVFAESSLVEGAERATPLESDGAYTIISGMQSFRVLIEVPIIVMIICQSNVVSVRLANLVAILLKGLAVRIPANTLQQQLTPKGLRVRQFRYETMLMCQVKMLSFLTYLLLSHPDTVVKHDIEMAYHLQNLLRIIPSESIAVRRELLVAMRHILTKDAHKALFPYLNALLDESVLLGTPGGRMDLAIKPMPPVASLPTYQSPQTQPLNPNAGGVQARVSARKQPLVHLAYAALIDLVSVLKKQLDMPQLSRVVYLLTRVIHDQTFSLLMQFNSIRALLNLVDCIYHFRDPQQQGKDSGESHNLLVKVLDALARKLSTLRYMMRRIAVMDRVHAAQANVPKSVEGFAVPMEWFLHVRQVVTPPQQEEHKEGSAPSAPTETEEVVRVDIVPTGQTGVRRKRPTSANDLGEHRELDRAFVLGIAAPYDASSYLHESAGASDTMKDVCAMIRMILPGLKTVLYCLSNPDQPKNNPQGGQQQQGQQAPSGAPNSGVAAKPQLMEEEVRLISKAFAWSLQCMVAYDVRINPDRAVPELEVDESDVIDLLSGAFIVLDPSVFSDVMQENIMFFYKNMLKHRKIAKIATNFLRSNTMSRAFASVLIPFLLSRFYYLGGRNLPVASSLERYVETLLPFSSDGSDDSEYDPTWQYLGGAADRSSARPYEVTYFGGSEPPRVISPVPPNSFFAGGPDAASFGLFTEDRSKVDAAFKDPEGFTADEESFLISKLFKAAMQHLHQHAVKSSTGPHGFGGSAALVSLISGYLEPAALACLSTAAESMAFPLESLRRGTDNKDVVIKPETEDVADHCLAALKAALSVTLEAPPDAREALRSTITRIARPLAKGMHRLLMVCTQNPRNHAAMHRGDMLAEMCIALTHSLLDDLNILALPYAHALSAFERGNDIITTKALSWLERIGNSFDRICIARAGLVAKTLRHLVKRSATHSTTAIKLLGKASFEPPAQYFFADQNDESYQSGLKLKVPWKGAPAMTELNLTNTIEAVCAYIEDSFTPPKLQTTTQDAESMELESVEMHQKREAVDLVASFLKNMTFSATPRAGDSSLERDLLSSMITCSADVYVSEHAWTLMQDQILLRPTLLGRAVARAAVSGCVYRCRAAEKLLVHVASSQNDANKRKVLKEAVGSLLELVKEKTWHHRTGGLFALCVCLRSPAGKAVAKEFEEGITSSICHSLTDHQHELGMDALYHGGNALHELFCHLDFSLSQRSIDSLISALAKTENHRARRIVRLGFYLVFRKAPPAVRKALVESTRALLEKLRAAPLTKFESNSLLFLACRMELCLFLYEAMTEVEQDVLALAREVLRDVHTAYAGQLKDDLETPLNDPEAYPFTFAPSHVVLRASFLRLARRVVVRASADEDPVAPDAIVILGMNCLSSAWPAVSKAAEMLFRTLSISENHSGVLTTIAKARVAEALDGYTRGQGLSVNGLRGIERMLHRITPQLKATILPSTFATDILAILANRCDPAKVFESLAALPGHRMPGEEVFVAAVLIDVLSRTSTTMIIDNLEGAILNSAKYEAQMHLLHFSNFSSTATALANSSQSQGKPINFRMIVGSYWGPRLSSPVRSALSRLFAVVPSESLRHIFSNDRLIKRSYSALLCDLLKRYTEGESLRQELIQNSETMRAFMKATFEAAYDPPPALDASGVAASPQHAKLHEQATRRAQAKVVELRYQGVRIVRSIVKWAPEIIRIYPELATSAIASMKSPDREVKMAAEEKLPLRHRTLARIACKSIIAGFRAGAPVSILCDILPVTLIRSTTDTLFLSDFFSKYLRTIKGSLRSEIISAFTKQLVDSRTSVPVREAILRLVIVPVLATFFIQRAIFFHLQKTHASQDVLRSYGLDHSDASSLTLPEEAFRSLLTMILTDRAAERQQSSDIYGPASAGEDFEVQVLQLSTLLIAHSGKELMEHRKALIRLSWNYLNGEDSPTKYWSYMNICTFIDVYHTPADIILQVYVELLRAHTTEARDLVCRALDLLAPSLHKRMEVSKYLKAIKWTKKLLFDDGHHLPQLTHVFQMVTRHPYIFYQYRAQFVPQMVTSLSRVALISSAPFENRELAVNVIELLLSWETTREIEEKRASSTGNSPSGTNSNQAGSLNREEVTRSFRLASNLYSIMAQVLLRLTIQLLDSRDSRSKALSKRCILLLRACLDIADRRSERPVVLPFSILSKYIVQQSRSQETAFQKDLEEVKRVMLNIVPSMDVRTVIPPAPWDRRIDPGIVSSSLELLFHIISVQGNCIANYFLEKNAGELAQIIDPVLSCFERDVHLVFAKLVMQFLRHTSLTAMHSPLLEVPGPSHQSHEERAGAFTGAVSHGPPPPPANVSRAFYPSLLQAIHKRLQQASDDPKKLEANVSLPGVNAPPQPAPSGQRGTNPRPQSSSSQISQISKALQQRVAREVVIRQLEYTCAGPRGVVNVLKVLQIICGCDEPAPYPGVLELKPSQVGTSSITERFVNSLLKLLNRSLKDLLAGYVRTPSSGGSSKIPDQQAAEDVSMAQKNRPHYAQAIDITLALLASVPQMPSDHKRLFMQLIVHMLERVDAAEHLVLQRVVKVVAQWFHSKMLSSRERAGFWAKLSALEARVAGTAGSTRLVEEIHELALTCPPPRPRAAMVAGILSPSPRQRAKFWTMNFGACVANSNDLLVSLLTGRREDIISLGSKYWLPIAFRLLVESRLMIVHDTDLFHLLSRVAFADGAGLVANAAWKDFFKSAWSVANNPEKQALAQAITLLGLTSPHSTTSLSTVQQQLEAKRPGIMTQFASSAQLSAGWRRTTRGYMMATRSAIRDLVIGAFEAGVGAYLRPQEVRQLGSIVGEDRHAALFALEDCLQVKDGEQVRESLLQQYFECGDDEMVRGLLMTSNLPSLTEGLQYELATDWENAIKHYLDVIDPTSTKDDLSSTKARMTKYIENIGSLTGFSDIKRLRRTWNDEVTTDEDDDTIGETTDASTKATSRLAALGVDMRLRKCMTSIGQWREVFQWAQSERDVKLSVEAIARRPDLIRPGMVEEIRRRMAGLPLSPYSILDQMCVDIYVALKDATSSNSELDDMMKRAYREVQRLFPYPTKGIAQRLVEIEEAVTTASRIQRQPVEARSNVISQLLGAWTQRPPTGTTTVEEFAAIASWRLEFLRVTGVARHTPELDQTSGLVLLQAARHARLRGFLTLANSYVEQALKIVPPIAPSNPKSFMTFELLNERNRIILTPPDIPHSKLAQVYADLEDAKKMVERKDQLGEIHRMQGRILSLVGKPAAIVDEAFAHALQYDATSNARTWLDWSRTLASHGDAASAAVAAARAMAIGLAFARLLVPLLLEPSGAAMPQIESISASGLVPWIPILLQEAANSPFAKASLDRMVALETADRRSTSEAQALLCEVMADPVKYQHWVEALRKAHPDMLAEYLTLKEFLQSVTSGHSGLNEWRPRALRIPGTRRRLERIISHKRNTCGRRTEVPRVDLYSDDGRPAVRYALHVGDAVKTTMSNESKKRFTVFLYVISESLIQDGGFAEYYCPPSVIHIDEATMLEKDAEVNSLNHIVATELGHSASVRPSDSSASSQALKRWFVRQFDDYETFLNARRRLSRQLAVHSLATSLDDGKNMVGAPCELLIGRGFESTFVLFGLDSDQEKDRLPNLPPFRLTPNLEALLTPQGVAGPFTIALSSAARALSKWDARKALEVFMGADALTKHDVLNAKDEVRDTKIQAMVREAIGFNSSVPESHPWMGWM